MTSTSKLRAAVLPVTQLQQNCAIIWDDATKQAIVVDPGGDVDRIIAAIDELGVTVERLLLTHGHLDHAGGAAVLQARLRARSGDASGIPLEGPDERDLFLLERLEEQSRAYGIVGARNVIPDRWLHEGDVVSLGQHKFDVLHCPGHTPGHIVFVNHAARFALLGDVLFRGSIGRTDFPYGDTEALLDAITTKLLPLGDDMVFLCGHGPGSTIGTERESNPFLQQ